MFPFRPNNHTQDFGAPIPDNNPFMPDKLIQDDLIKGHEGFLGSGLDLTPSTSDQREGVISFGIQENEEKFKKDQVNNVRKFVHRENERQRRQEMGNLYGSLRTLLPLEYIKGKQSMPDQLQGAVNYIKDMQNNIHQLKTRRDKLKKLPNLGSNSQIHGDNKKLPNWVTVNPCPSGVEILINAISEEEQGFCLSRILTELLQEGFNVVSYFSTKADERSLHNIQLEASKLIYDVSGLQERLTCMINFPQ